MKTQKTEPGLPVPSSRASPGDRLTRPICNWALVLLLLAAPSLCVAGDVDCPAFVMADENGVWSVEIRISNTDNPDLQIVEREGTTITGVQMTPLGNRNWKYVVRGQLTNPGKNGRVRFCADPEGAVVCEDIAIIAYGNPIPTLSEWGLIIFGVVLLGFITYVFLGKESALASLH